MDIRQGSDKDKETRGDAMIWYLWDRQDETIIYVKINDANVDSYKYEPMAALLTRWETINKDKHGKKCTLNRKT